MYQEKIEGQPCQNCQDGKYVRSPKTGKVFCDKKCWLVGQPQSPQTQNLPPRMSEAPQGIDLSQYLLKSEFEVILKRQREAFTELTARMAEVTSQVEYFKELWKTQNPTAYEAHKDQLEEIPVIGVDKV